MKKLFKSKSTGTKHELSTEGYISLVTDNNVSFIHISSPWFYDLFEATAYQRVFKPGDWVKHGTQGIVRIKTIPGESLWNSCTQIQPVTLIEYPDENKFIVILDNDVCNGRGVVCLEKSLIKLADSEIETYLTQEAIKRGYQRDGVRIKIHDTKETFTESGNITFEYVSDKDQLRLHSDKYKSTLFKNWKYPERECYLPIYENGKWEEIVTQPTLEINGHELEVGEFGEFSFGWAKFYRRQLDAIIAFNTDPDSNQYITEITLNSGVRLMSNDIAKLTAIIPEIENDKTV